MEDVDAVVQRALGLESGLSCTDGDRNTHLLALLDDTVPQILSARGEVLQSVSHDLLYRLLGTRGRSGRPEYLMIEERTRLVAGAG